VVATTSEPLRIPVAVIRGRIAIPDKDPKTWRAKGRKRGSQPRKCRPSSRTSHSPQEIGREKRRGDVDLHLALTMANWVLYARAIVEPAPCGYSHEGDRSDGKEASESDR
jgi:hypothetical protein